MNVLKVLRIAFVENLNHKNPLEKGPNPSI